MKIGTKSWCLLSQKSRYKKMLTNVEMLLAKFQKVNFKSLKWASRINFVFPEMQNFNFQVEIDMRKFKFNALPFGNLTFLFQLLFPQQFLTFDT